MRIEKVNELISQELGRIIQEEIEFEPGVMATIMRTDTSETLENATVYISIFPEAKRGSAIGLLNEKIGDLQKLLNRRLFLRFVPKILFKIDDSVVFLSELDKTFDEIREK
ncbi:30S ribosome-binding factor RbfA [Candidatus Microgenomates bacterium]|nr:30S ribosome-binding factor RbfA [Candidatus Microgenomates bacterium]